MSRSFIKEKALPLFVLAALAILAYIPTLAQPFISDDYPSIRLALLYGPISGWEAMANDSVHRVRAITVIFPYVIHRIFGLQPAAFYSASILLHVLNCWLLFAVGRWRIIGFKVSFWAAAFFAVYEGHQEAIMWFSGCSELLMFLFGFLSFLFWLIFLEKGLEKETSRWGWLALSFFFFLLALLSKEASVIFIALFALPLLFPQSELNQNRKDWYKPRRNEDSEERKRSNLFFSSSSSFLRGLYLCPNVVCFDLRQTLYLLPYISIGVVYVIVVFMARSHSFRFHDQSFVLSAPFWVTWTKSYGAMLWFWGLSATVWLILRRECRQPFLLSFIWMGIGFIPYMFVDYMHRIPSRQTYLASAGLAWLMGATIVMVKERYGKRYKWIVSAVLLIILVHNIAFLWTRKRQQFLERARPTEQLLSFARSVDGPIFVKCFPLAPIHAEAALELILNKPASTLIWKEEAKQPQAATFCYER